MPYRDFWHTLKTQNTQDLSHKSRLAWKKLQIELPMCYGTFRKFKADFDAAKGRVEDRTVVEEREVLMAALSDTQKLMVVKEEAARNRNKFFIQFLGLEHLSAREVAEQLPMLEPLEGERGQRPS